MNKPQGSRRILRILPGLILSGLAIAALVWIVDWRATGDAWSRANLWVLLPAFACILGGMLARAVGWRFLMGNPVPLRKCFWVLNISYLLNGILPFRLGDVARAFLISRNRDADPAYVPAGNAPSQHAERETPSGVSTGRVLPLNAERKIPSGVSTGTAPPVNAERKTPSGVSTGTALSAVVLERVFDLIFTFVLVLSVFPMIAGGEWSSQVQTYTFGIALAGFVGLLLTGMASRRISQLAHKVADRIRFLRPLLGPLEHFLEGLRQMRDLRRSLPGFLFIGLGMIIWAAEYWVVLVGFFPGASLYWGLLSLIGGLIGVMLPSSPSSLGVFEAAVVLVLTMSGMMRDTAVAFAIAIHMFNIICLISLGLLGLLIERQSLGSILSAAQSSPPRPEEKTA